MSSAQPQQLLTNTRRIKPHKYVCPYCPDKKWQNKAQKEAHMRIKHDVGDMLECEQCEKKFGDIRNLQRHIKTEHNLLDEKAVFRCPFCNELKKRKDNAQRHVLRCSRRPGQGLIEGEVQGLEQIEEIQQQESNVDQAFSPDESDVADFQALAREMFPVQTSNSWDLQPSSLQPTGDARDGMDQSQECLLGQVDSQLMQGTNCMNSEFISDCWQAGQHFWDIQQVEDMFCPGCSQLRGVCECWLPGAYQGMMQ